MSSLDRAVNAVREAIERVLPWYDPEAEVRHHEATEQLRQRAIAGRRMAEMIEPRLGSYRRISALHGQGRR